ncbi:MAG: AAA family ATPase [Planctomycetaceae bacterium]
MIQLPALTTPKPAADVPDRPLDSIVLPGDLADRVRALLAEWEQSEKLARYGMTPRNRVLLYGPPGNGKATLAAAIATELKMPLTVIPHSEISSGTMGQQSKQLVAAFQPTKRAKCILFFDECDSLCNRRSTHGDSASKEENNTVNALLMALDQLPSTCVVIFATNFPQVLDPAFARRINLHLEMPAPDLDDLRRLHQSLLRRHPLWPIADFPIDTCGAPSFAVCEQMIQDFARAKILDPRFDPLNLAGKPRSAWLRDQLAKQTPKPATV